MRACIPCSGQKKAGGLFPQHQCHIALPIFRKTISFTPLFSLSIRKAPTPNAVITEKMLKLGNKNSMHAFWTALTWQHIRFTWKILKRVNAQIQSQEMQVHWACIGVRVSVSSNNKALWLVKGLRHRFLVETGELLLFFL